MRWEIPQTVDPRELLCVACGNPLSPDEIEHGSEVCARCQRDDELFDEGAERWKGCW